MEQDEKRYPFLTMVRDDERHKVFGIVTNMARDGRGLIEWHYGRCGGSEQAHGVMKQDLDGGTPPGGDFGEKGVP